MTTVDQLLLQIINFTEPAVEDYLAKRDSRVLRSLASIVTAGNFFTENQARLLLKILKENTGKFHIFTDQLDEAFTAPTWSKAFRKIDVVKKMYISPNVDGGLCINLEFTYSGGLRKTLGELSKNLEGLIQLNSGKLYQADLTERNIVNLVEAFKPMDFEIDEKILSHYEIIKSWSESEIRNQFTITSMTNTNFQKHITDDLGISTAIDQNIINDRSIRYQYVSEKSKKPENLTEFLATRTATKCWVDKSKINLNDIIGSLIDLKRFPLLVIFDSYDADRCYTELQDLSENLAKYGIYDNIGIYFRLPNSDIGKEFNQFIGENKFNGQLDSNSCVVGIQGGKIPKFLLKSDWKPMSVICVGNPLKNSKTAVYSNCCDLIISYSNNAPLASEGMCLYG